MPLKGMIYLILLIGKGARIYDPCDIGVPENPRPLEAHQVVASASAADVGVGSGCVSEAAADLKGEYTSRGNMQQKRQRINSSEYEGESGKSTSHVEALEESRKKETKTAKCF